MTEIFKLTYSDLLGFWPIVSIPSDTLSVLRHPLSALPCMPVSFMPAYLPGWVYRLAINLFTFWIKSAKMIENAPSNTSYPCTGGHRLQQDWPLVCVLVTLFSSCAALYLFLILSNIHYPHLQVGILISASYFLVHGLNEIIQSP